MQNLKNIVKDKNVCAQLLASITDLVLKNPPKPTNPARVIKLIMDELSPHVEETDLYTIRTLIEKHVQRTHPVYEHMVSVLALGSEALMDVFSNSCVMSYGFRKCRSGAG